MIKTLPKTCSIYFSQLLYICFFSLSFFGISNVASAATLYQNLASDMKTGNNDFMLLGTGLSFTPTGVRIGGSTDGGDVNTYLIANFVCTNALPFSGNCGEIAADTEFIATTTDGVIEFTYTGAPALDPTKYYYLNINLRTPTGGQNMWGSSSADPNGFLCGSWPSNSANCNGKTSMYYEIAGTGGFDPPPPTDTSTRILTLNPLQNEATSSDPTVFGTFYNQSPTYNQLLLDLSWVEPSVNADLLLSGLAHRQFIFDIGTSTSNQSFSTTTSDLLTGRWLMSAQFSNGLSGSDYFTASSTTFIVGTSSTLYSQFYETYTASTSSTTAGSVISDCSSAGNIIEKSLCSLGDRIRDVLQFLFIPDSSVVAKYQALKDNILSRVPFGYFPLVKNALLSASASSTPVYTYIMPVARQPLFGSLRTGLAAILYLWWIIHMFHRFKSIQL